MEILIAKLYQFKPGSKRSVGAGSSIESDIDSLTEVKFEVTQKGVRDRLKLLLDKFKRRMRN